MVDYQDIQGELNTLESSWPGYADGGFPLEDQLNRVRANVSDAAKGDPDGLQGALNNLDELVRQAWAYNDVAGWVADVDNVIADIEAANG